MLQEVLEAGFCRTEPMVVELVLMDRAILSPTAKGLWIIRELGIESINPFQCPSNPLSFVEVHESMQHRERGGKSWSD